MYCLPVGKIVSDMPQIGGEDVEPLVGQVAQPGGRVRVRGMSEVLQEVGRGVQDFGEGRQDPVVGGGQLREGVGNLFGALGFPDPDREVSDLVAEGEVMRFASLGGEDGVGVEVVADGLQAGHGPGGEAVFLVLVEAGGQTVVGLVAADHGYEPGALKEAVGFRIASTGEDFTGVRIAPDGQNSVGKGQEENAFCKGESGQRPRGERGVGKPAERSGEGLGTGAPRC